MIFSLWIWAEHRSYFDTQNLLIKSKRRNKKFKKKKKIFKAIALVPVLFSKRFCIRSCCMDREQFEDDILIWNDSEPKNEFWHFDLKIEL